MWLSWLGVYKRQGDQEFLLVRQQKANTGHSLPAASYSARSAIIGSTLVARRAGTSVATSETVAMTPTTMA